MTIRQRLTLYYAVLLTMIIIVFGAITYGVMRWTMIGTIDSTLQDTATLITTNSRLLPVPGFGAPSRIEIELASLDLFRASGVYVQAWEMVEEQPHFKESSINAHSLGSTALDSATLGHSQPVFSNVTINNVLLRVLTMPVIQSSSGRLVGNIQVATELETVNRASKQLLVVVGVSCVFAIFGAMILSMWFSHRAIAPIEHITQAASSIAGTNDLSTRLHWQGPADELGKLISVFNQMMGRIQHLFSVQQRFVADISHELRTPLTAIQGNIALMKRYGVDAASLDDIESECQRMTHLINDLLMLARADYGGIKITLTPIDLDTVVIECINSAKVIAKDRKLDIRLGHFQPVRVKGDHDRLKQLVSNLLNNAIKFTPDGGSILVTLGSNHEHAVLTVKDTGIGIHKEDMDRIFDRFYQTESSRVHHDGEGFGLGLSIVKWVVEAHHGTINVSSEPSMGATFTVIFPLYRSHTHGDEETPPYKRPTRTRMPSLRKMLEGGDEGGK
ncbi:MAG: HAMP domain-containing sensor histidine kinase [Phototrophicales bacterium]|nr:HAMP domain-containing sensor histidine kinase [Phototrophicales bacterium]